jgi:cytochrome P450
MPFPSNAIAAVTHPDPYPYYLALLDRPALHRDESLGLWIAARADVVTAVLAHPDCRVRPPTEPVPRALVGTPAGDVFGQLVRMTDGEAHYTRKPAVAHALHALDLAAVADESRRWAMRLPVDQLDELPVRVVASVLGARDSSLTDVVQWTRDLMQCFAHPDGERGSIAATNLLGVFPDANTIGYLIQSHDATAGLIGNTVVALAAGRADPLPDLVRWVVRHDPPIHNTRRYPVAGVSIFGHDIRRGETILVVLAAANLDSSAYGPFTFGIGPHACPGAQLATTIATAAVGALMDSGVHLPGIERTGYRPLPNARVPTFARRTTGSAESSH